ncbi:MAG: hypothetical protein L6W00_26120 [Lentisphaeria bacterium]|nr:MAG: hypothetical protein L6W00_26120 [Lentisphaeria bacterium]
MMTEFEAMWDLFRRAAEQPVKQLFFADVRPLPPQSEFVHQHPCPRLLIQLAGSTRIHHARGGQLSTKNSPARHSALRPSGRLGGRAPRFRHRPFLDGAAG